MKTFKMISFDLLLADHTQQIPLIDGIIINQENSHHSWILELYIPNNFNEVFEPLLASGDVFEARAVISFPDNEPAPFTLVVSKIKHIGDHISVLLKGTLKAQRKRYAEQLLQELLVEGLSNDQLLDRFKQGMKERPKLKGM
ncbi:YwpF family protein [Lysinibacillus sp. KU-BSD001]|uniref:YwpF family protein n=1 Tax=Lysinibacillus sp. KU-BSD001 TaxID=3141328 RepID=UPI0036ED5A98